MIRISRLGQEYYGFEFDDLEDELENITGFLNEGTPVIIVTELDDLDGMDILFDKSEVKVHS